ncbi:MAG: hypothetical protein ABEJ35_06625 [Halobacteriaceae archaeon]
MTGSESPERAADADAPENEGDGSGRVAAPDLARWLRLLRLLFTVLLMALTVWRGLSGLTLS